MAAAPGSAPRARSDPRGFCGDGYPWPLIQDLRDDGREVTACYLVHEKQRRETRQAKPFLKLVLGDRTGVIDAMVWDNAERLDAVVAQDEVVGVRGRVGSYQERLQIVVNAIEPLAVGDDDLGYFLPASPRDRAQMQRELDGLVGGIGDPGLRGLVERCVGRRTALGKQFRTHPAAKRNHHAYIGGLMEHSVSVAGSARRLGEHYAGQGADLDHDVLLAGALLHDIGKVRELSAGRAFLYTDEGQLLGHIVIGMQMVAREAQEVKGLAPERLLHLQHLIASHQGRLEWASPKVPQTLEALILHYADDLDSKMVPAIQLLGGVEAGTWSGFDRHLERQLYNPPSFPPSGPVEPVPPEEVVEALIDMFRG